MRPVRQIVVTVLASGLLASSAIPAMAQDDLDSSAPSYFTGTLGQPAAGIGPDEEATQEFEDGALVRGVGFSGAPLEVSDARLSGDLSVVANVDVWESGTVVGAEVIEFGAEQYRIVNEDGAWFGPGTAFTVDRSDVAAVRSVVLTGEGDYAGLSAYLLIEFTPEPVVQGAILPRELPPLPEPLPAE